MRFEPSIVKRAVAAIGLAVVLAGCGGGTDEVSVTTSTVDDPTSTEGSELAGVHVEVRRDPG